MSRDLKYQRLLNSPRWREVKRIVWQRDQGLCTECRKNGLIVPGVDCHHLYPIEKSMSVQEMTRWAYDPDNVTLLCVPCHIKAHQILNSHKKEQVKANRQRQQERWRDQLMQRFRAESNEDEDENGETMRADGSTP